MIRGDYVRPSLEVCESTNFRPSSRLRVSEKKAPWPSECSGCGGVLLVGELYAKGSEQSRPLCLECVVPEPGPVAA